MGEGNTSLFKSNNNSLKSFPSTRAKIVQMTRNYHVKEEVEWYINNHVEFLVVIFEFFFKPMCWYLYYGSFTQACL